MMYWCYLLFLLQEGSDISSTASTLSVGSDNEDQPEDLDLPLSQSSPLAKGAQENTVDSEFSPKMAKAIVKSVCGKILTREECVKLLKSKFSVQARNLTSLTPSQLLQVASKKLVRYKYVTVPQDVETSQLKTADIQVNREIELWFSCYTVYIHVHKSYKSYVNNSWLGIVMASVKWCSYMLGSNCFPVI